MHVVCVITNSCNKKIRCVTRAFNRNLENTEAICNKRKIKNKRAWKMCTLRKKKNHFKSYSIILSLILKSI